MINKITDKTIKRIKKGYHDDLMGAIEFLIDSYDEDKFDAGYKSRIADESVFAYRLAEHIFDSGGKGVTKLGKDNNGEPVEYFEDVDSLAKVIENYFNKALK